MTRESFEKALMDNEIWWNSMAELEVLNPNHKSALFNLCPKTITFVGALGHKKNDPNVSLWVVHRDKQNNVWAFKAEGDSGIVVPLNKADFLFIISIIFYYY